MIISSNKRHSRNQSSKEQKIQDINIHSFESRYCILHILYNSFPKNSQSCAKTIRRTMQVPKNYSSNLYLEETKESHIKGNNFLHTDSHHQGPQRKCLIK